MDWEATLTVNGAPMAILKDGAKVIVKVYLSPDSKTLRFALPEMEEETQLKIDTNNRLIDFRRAL
jgi:hypothetical protein